MDLRLGRRLQSLYDRLYGALAGCAPDVRIWHFQWLPQRTVETGLADALQSLRGQILDVGCGRQPYRHLIHGDVTGTDIIPGPGVDVLIPPDGAWPFDDDSFDGLLCTQVLEHVAKPEQVLSEMARVLKPGALAVISAPFSYHEHGSPHDYRRWSRHGVARLVGDHLTVEQVRTQGSIGSLLGTAALAWSHESLSGRVGLMLRLLLLPALLAYTAIINVVGIALDAVDRTDAFYGNVVVLARKPLDA